MRVAALYDIHGNLPALEAVLESVRGAMIDHVLVGGDVVLGPMPRETLACLLDLGIPVQFIRGNCDREVLGSLADRTGSTGSPSYRQAMRWVAQQLRADDRRMLTNWPETVRLKVSGLGEVLFCHATPRNDTDIFTRLTPEDRLLPLFQNLGVPMVVCGHTHMPFDRTIGRVRVVNAGSVGMPFGAPGADWLLLGPEVRLQHTTYDLATAADRIRGTAYPQADEFVQQSLMKPPSEQEMLDRFSKVEVG